MITLLAQQARLGLVIIAHSNKAAPYEHERREYYRLDRTSLPPQLQDFQPDLEALQAWLAAWGMEKIDAALAFGSADEWDVDNFDLLADEEDLPLLDVASFLDRDDLVSAHLLLDPGPCELVPMMREIAEGCRGQWTPCAATITLGPRTIPDLSGEQTAARANCSFIIGGPGALNKPLKSMQVIQSQNYCLHLSERLQQVWQHPVPDF